jgi:hypothetical protein
VISKAIEAAGSAEPEHIEAERKITCFSIGLTTRRKNVEGAMLSITRSVGYVTGWPLTRVDTASGFVFIRGLKAYAFVADDVLVYLISKLRWKSK